MDTFFTKTFSELITPEPLEIHGIGETPITTEQLSGLWSVVNYRFENLLPTTTYTDKKPFELCKALCNNPEYETLAYAVVGRLFEMGRVPTTQEKHFPKAKDYKELYALYEEDAELHPETEETAEAERELNDLIHKLPAETMQQLDTAIGRLVRAYEKQGFLFGMNAGAK